MHHTFKNASFSDVIDHVFGGGFFLKRILNNTKFV